MTRGMSLAVDRQTPAGEPGPLVRIELERPDALWRFAPVGHARESPVHIGTRIPVLFHQPALRAYQRSRRRMKEDEDEKFFCTCDEERVSTVW